MSVPFFRGAELKADGDMSIAIKVGLIGCVFGIFIGYWAPSMVLFVAGIPFILAGYEFYEILDSHMYWLNVVNWISAVVFGILYFRHCFILGWNDD